MAKKPLVLKPGWNGQVYKGDNWIVANTMTASRPLTKQEQDRLEKAFVSFAITKGHNVTVTKTTKGTTISFKGK